MWEDVNRGLNMLSSGELCCIHWIINYSRLHSILESTAVGGKCSIASIGENMNLGKFHYNFKSIFHSFLFEKKKKNLLVPLLKTSQLFVQRDLKFEYCCLYLTWPEVWPHWRQLVWQLHQALMSRSGGGGGGGKRKKKPWCVECTLIIFPHWSPLHGLKSLPTLLNNTTVLRWLICFDLKSTRSLLFLYNRNRKRPFFSLPFLSSVVLWRLKSVSLLFQDVGFYSFLFPFFQSLCVRMRFDLAGYDELLAALTWSEGRHKFLQFQGDCFFECWRWIFVGSPSRGLTLAVRGPPSTDSTLIYSCNW